jgi:RND family efflux transporter MFP subunit
MMMRRSLLRWAVPVVLLAVGLGAWLLLGGRPVMVQTAAVERGPAAELVYATGYVEAEHPVSVSTRITAPVREVLVQEGDRVARGQALIVQDNAEQLGLLAQASAQAQGATLAEQRVLALYAQGWATKKARDEAVYAAQAARASAGALRARLDQMTVRAGISGVVLKRDVEPGDLVTPGKLLLQLGDPASARVTATVDERDIPRVRRGQSALMSSDGLPGKVVRGHVSEITPGGDPSQRAFRVRIGFDKPETLPFGLTLEVNIVTRAHENALLVPSGAVADGKVWVVEDGRATSRAVRTGVTGTDRTEVLSGLAQGDRVIVNPPKELEEGQRVRS